MGQLDNARALDSREHRGIIEKLIGWKLNILQSFQGKFNILLGKCLERLLGVGMSMSNNNSWSLECLFQNVFDLLKEVFKFGSEVKAATNRKLSS